LKKVGATDAIEEGMNRSNVQGCIKLIKSDSNDINKCCSFELSIRQRTKL